MADDKLISAIVAQGRTVHVATNDKILVGHVDGREITRLRHYEAGPGETVRLTESEVKRLREQGFLVDPEAVAKAAEIAANNPAVTVQTQQSE